MNSVQTSTAKVEAANRLSNRRQLKRPFGQQSFRGVEFAKRPVVLVELEFNMNPAVLKRDELPMNGNDDGPAG